jgi:hypothetical protein
MRISQPRDGSEENTIEQNIIVSTRLKNNQRDKKENKMVA